MRAHFTLCPRRSASSEHGDRRGRNSKAKRGRPQGRRMKCGWRCGARLTGRQMRAHSATCPKRPAGSGHVARAGGNSQARRDRPPGLRMLCGLGLRRATHCEGDAGGFTGAADKMRLGSRLPAYRTQYARASQYARSGRQVPATRLKSMSGPAVLLPAYETPVHQPGSGLCSRLISQRLRTRSCNGFRYIRSYRRLAF
jgi:hypothetical protein